MAPGGEAVDVFVPEPKIDDRGRVKVENGASLSRRRTCAPPWTLLYAGAVV